MLSGEYFCGAVMFLTLSFFCPAEVPAPFLRMSFDREFHADGAGAGKLQVFPGSVFPGIEKAPAGEFVEGISGKAFIPREDLKIQGQGIFPAPEGTLSLWIKPVNYEEDWVGGPALTTGKIGSFVYLPPWAFKSETGAIGWGYMPVRLNRHDCCSGLAWVENWNEEPTQRNTSYDGPIPPFAIWQKDKWRMLTVVWFKGERRVYFNGVRIQHSTEVRHNNITPAGLIVIPAGSKVVDDLRIWDTPLSDGQVAALFYSQTERSGLSGAVQEIPRVSGNFDVPDAGWNGAMKSSSWTESYSGTASENKPYSDKPDTLEAGHRDGYLFIRYREPMPEDYIPVKTLIGGHMLKRTTAGRDADIWQDDCVEVRLSPDGGKTEYLLGASASGALYDSRGGDKEFNLSDGDWKVVQSEDEKSWTVEMKINLKSLSEGALPSEWGFNIIRTVRQQGYAKRQWSYSASGGEHGKIRLAEAGVLSSDISWSSPTGKLKVHLHGMTGAPVTVSYGIKPLNFLELFPEENVDKGVHRMDITGMIAATGRLDKMPLPVEKEEVLPAGALSWEGSLDYAGEWAALAEVVAKDASGKVISRRNALVSGSQAVSMRTFNLPGKREMVTQVFLASETLAGDDVVTHVKILPGAGGDAVIEKEIEGFPGIMREITLDVSKIAAGPYRVEVSLEKGGSLLGKTAGKWFKSGDPVWLGNDIGVIKEVPAPWSPVRHEKETLKVWGREHSFKNSLLPVSMKVLGEEILAGPMRLIIETEGGTLDTSAAETPVITVDKAGVKSAIRGKAAGAGVIVEMEGEMEFDGFAYLRFTFRPEDIKNPVTVKSIVLEAPFRKEYAKLYDDSDYGLFRTRSGSIPEEGMEVESTGCARVGDEERGVQFYPLFGVIGKRTTSAPLSFTPGKDAVVMRHVISEGVRLEGEISEALGFIGTPVKPCDAKRIRMTGHAYGEVDAQLAEKGYSSTYYWFSTWTNYNGGEGTESGYFNYSPGWCEGLAKSLKDDWEKKRHYGLLKIQPGLITVRSPEYAYFWKEWGGRYYDGLEEFVLDLATYRGADVRPPGIWTEVDWTNESWQDFFFYCMDKVLSSFAKEGVRVGIYVDCTNHGGDPRPYRRWVQRLHQVTRKHSPDGLIVIHMSGDRNMAIWGMADCLAEGEQYSANWQAHMVGKPELTLNDCFPTVLPLDRVRATYVPSLWGAQPIFLSQLWTDPRQGEDVRRKETGDPGPSYYRRMRHITGLLLLHDCHFWGEFYGCGAKYDPWVKRAHWGYDDTVQFMPYWDNKDMLEVEYPEGKEALASAWLRPDGNLMVLLFNNASEDTVVKLKFHPGKFPVKLKEFTRAEDITSPVVAFNPEATEPDTYEYNAGNVKVEMRARDLRLLVFR